jgi:hypothetical protein
MSDQPAEPDEELYDEEVPLSSEGDPDAEPRETGMNPV